MKASNKVLVGSLLGTLAVPAFALPVDYTTLLAAADFSTTTAAIISIAGIVAVVYVAWKGAKMVLAALKAG
jgi:hypothetical protein